MRHIHYILILFVLASCSGPKKKAEIVRPELVYPEYGFIAADYKYDFFGKLGYMERSFQEDTLLFPPIENLVHGSAYALCPTDTCFAEYAVLAFRCPPIQPLLDWVADTVHTFVRDCPIGNGLITYNDKSPDIPVKHMKTDREICDYYIGQLRHVYDGWHCSGEGDHNIINEQAGLLLADCWNVNNLHTFYRIDWYDWLSGGNNVRESWWTVDATSGKLLSLSDFILPDKLDSLAALMMPRLVNGKDSFILDKYPYVPEDFSGILQGANGCALIPEGLVVYFYPYNLGAGADGEYEAIIPYDELEGILKKPLSMVLVPAKEKGTDVCSNHPNNSKPNIDLFGASLVGSPKHILRKINKGDYVKIDLGPDGFLKVLKDRFFCRVLIDGIPFAMNVSYGDNAEKEVVKEVTFVSSATEEYVMDSLLKSLVRYYGKPAIGDGEDGGYTWFPDGRLMKARRIHSLDEGGWTFYISDLAQ